MTVTFGDLTMRVRGYDDADDILVLERLGGLEERFDSVFSAESDVLSLDSRGQLVGMEIFDARYEFERTGRVTETLPDGTELTSTDVGRLWAPAETT